MSSNNHGGARPGSGPKSTPINERRVMSLIHEGVPYREVASRFGVGVSVIRRVIRDYKRSQA